MPPPTEFAAIHEAALQMLYAVELDRQEPAEVLGWFEQAHPAAAEIVEPAWALLSEVLARQSQIEELITRHSHHWRLERIGVVDRCLLKLAIAEMLVHPNQATSATNEALRMARRFSQPEIVAYLHALLEAVAADLTSQK